MGVGRWLKTSEYHHMGKGSKIAQITRHIIFERSLYAVRANKSQQNEDACNLSNVKKCHGTIRPVTDQHRLEGWADQELMKSVILVLQALIKCLKRK